MPLNHVATAVLLCALCAISPAQPPQSVGKIAVDPAHRYQIIEGFGVNYTGPYFRDEQKKMFDMLVDDLGVSMFRVVAYFVYSDWEVVNDNADPHSANWAYYDERYSNPVFEASWKGMRALNARGIRPVLALMGVVPPWMIEETSPPPTHPVCKGLSHGPKGRLRPDMYEEFAETVVTMAVYARRKAGIDFEYFSPLNETDCYSHGEGPRVDPEEMPKVLAAVARRLAKEGLGDVKLAVPDHAVISNDYVGLILKDGELMKQVGAFTLHTYGQHSVGGDVVKVKGSAHPHVSVWLTEYSGSNHQDKTANSEWVDFSLAANRRALTALNLGASALFYFNAFDDYEECTREHTYWGLFTSAGHVYTPKKRYYAARQLFRFVKPGSQRIAASTDAKGLTVSAFRDGGQDTITIVGVKEGGASRIQVTVPLAPATPRKWELYLTTRELNCRKTETLDAAGGALEFDLPEEAVFTLVGKGSADPEALRKPGSGDRRQQK